MVGQPRLDHAGAELVAQVEREVRQAHAVRERARAADRVGRAARALAVVLGVAPQLERHRDDLAVGAQRGDGRVDAAAHGHERALGHRVERRAVARRRAQRAGERVGGEVGGVQLADAQPAELGRHLRAADARGLEQRRAADELDRRAGRGDRRAAARGLEARVGDAVALDARR